MHVVTSSRILAVLVAGALVACGGNAGSPAQKNGDVAINIAATVGGPQVVLVRLYGPTTTQPGVPPAIDSVIAAQTVAGTLFVASFPSIPAGTYQVHAKGYVAFDVLPADYNNPLAPPTWESAAIDPAVTVTGGGSATANLFMQEIGVPTFTNNAPYVSAITSDVASVWSGTNGGTSTIANLTAALIDADGDLAGYAWSADVGGTFGTPSGTLTGGSASVTTTWTPPGGFGGTAHLFLEVYDSIFNASRVSITLTVQQTPGYGAVLVNVAYNNNPMMGEPLVANYILDPNTGGIIGGGGQIAPGASTLLSVSAWDPNGDALTFGFTDPGCGGTFDVPAVTGTGTSADPYFAMVTYTSNPLTPANTTCTVTADVLDGNGGELVLNLGLHIGLP